MMVRGGVVGKVKSTGSRVTAMAARVKQEVARKAVHYHISELRRSVAECRKQLQDAFEGSVYTIKEKGKTTKAQACEAEVKLALEDLRNYGNMLNILLERGKGKLSEEDIELLDEITRRVESLRENAQHYKNTHIWKR